MSGGLARRAKFVEDLRKERPHLLHLDSGDVFFKKTKLPLPDVLRTWDETPGLRDFMVATYQLTAEAIVDAYNLMGVDAICPGERDFLLGVDFLQKLRGRAKFPFLCANVYEKGSRDGKPVFEPYLVKEVAGLKVVLVGIATDWLYGLFPLIQGTRFEEVYRIEDPIDYLMRMKDELRSKGDLVVVLSHMGINEDLSFSRYGAGIDFLIGSCTPNVWDRAYKFERANPIRIYHTQEQGKGIGVLDYWWLGRGRPLFDLTDIALKRRDLGLVRTTLEGHHQSREARAAEPMPAEDKRQVLEAIDRQIAQLESRVRTLETEISISTEGYNHIRYEMVEMKLSLPEEPEVQARMTELKGALQALVEGWREKDRTAGVPEEVSTKYAGAASCKECHAPQHGFWEKTKHAQGLESLEKALQAVNPECIGCHTLGFREEGGYRMPYNSRRFAGIQCEHCHGPRVEHVRAPTKVPGPPVPESSCRPCHAGAGPKFDFASGLRIAGCPPEHSTSRKDRK